jgi:excisionase family DNA binding protein
MATSARPTDRAPDGQDNRNVPDPSRRLVTSAEAAAFLTLRESTLRDYSRRGLVPSVKIGRHLRFVEADLIRYLDTLRESLRPDRARERARG